MCIYKSFRRRRGLTRVEMTNLSEFKVYVTGAESSLTEKELIAALSGFEKGSVQIFDEAAIAGIKHIQYAFLHAAKAFEEGKNISRDQGLEILLRAAASRQIKEATERVGVKDPKKIVVGFTQGNEEEVLEELKAKKKEPEFGKETVVEKFGLNKDKDLEKQIVAKMVLLQLE